MTDYRDLDYDDWVRVMGIRGALFFAAIFILLLSRAA